jgi:hypothetical protein
MAGGQQLTFVKTSSNSISTTIRFTVPQNSDSIDIAGTTVMPEFGTITALLIALSIAAILVYGRFMKNNSGFGRGQF